MTRPSRVDHLRILRQDPDASRTTPDRVNMAPHRLTHGRPHMTDMQGDHRDGPWSWWYRFVAIYLGVVFVLIGTALIFGPPRWTGGNSLQILHAHLSIPWPAWGGLFILVGLGVFPRRTRLAAYCVGAVLAVFFTAMAILFSVFSGTITNPIAIGLATLSVPMLLAGIRYAVLVDGERR